jgi:hypothetical protein
MTTQQLSDNIDGLENNLISLSGQMDITKFMLPDSEILKNLIQLKSGYSKDDASQMIDGIKSSISNQINSAKSSVDAISSQLSDSAKKIYPLPKTNPFYQEVKDLKAQIRIAFMQFLKEVQSISQEFINNTIQSVSQITAITILVSAPPFNVPAAISLAILIIQEVNKMVDRIVDIINYLEPLKKLGIVISPDKMDSVTTPLNVAINTINGLITTLTTITDPLSALKSLIIQLSDPSNLGSQIDSLKKQISDKMDEINKLIKNRQDHKTQDSDLTTLQNSLTNLLSLNKKLIDNKLPDTVTDAINNLNNNKPVTQTYIYDVQLPDGTILNNLTDQDLTKLSQSYNIINKA